MVLLCITFFENAHLSLKSQHENFNKNDLAVYHAWLGTPQFFQGILHTGSESVDIYSESTEPADLTYSLFDSTEQLTNQ